MQQSEALRVRRRKETIALIEGTVAVLAVAGFVLYLTALIPYWVALICAPFTLLSHPGSDRAALYPLLLLATVVPAVVLRHFRRPYPRAWTIFATVAAFAATIAAPLTYWLALSRVSERATQVLGYSAVGYLPDSAREKLTQDTSFQSLAAAVPHSEMLCGAWLLIFLTLTLHLILSRQWSPRFLVWPSALFVASWLLFLLEPQHLFQWL